MRTSDRWRLVTLAAHLWWLSLQLERQRSRLQRAVERGMAMSDPALPHMAEPFHELCIRYCLLQREYLQQRSHVLLRHKNADRAA